MQGVFKCNIVSSEEEIFSGFAEMIIVKGSGGELGIKVGHAPLLTDLKPGPVKVVCHGGKEEIFYISGGFMEVQPLRVLVLADTAIRSDDLDEESLRKALYEAKKNMDNKKADFNYGKASAHLVEITAQLQTLEKIRKK